MKRLLSTVLILCAVLMTAYALSFNVGDVSLELIPKDSLYDKYSADIWNPSINLYYMRMLETGPTEVGLVVERENGVEYPNDNPDENMREHIVYGRLPFRNQDSISNSYFRFVVAEQASILRVGYDSFKADLMINGGLSTVFEAENGTDIVGFDGFFFVGTAINIFDKVSFKFGTHHYSGHYGDEVLEALHSYDDGTTHLDRIKYVDGEPGKVHQLEQYVRQNSLIFGVSSNVLPWLRLYAELDFLPQKMHVVRPWVLDPNKTLTDMASFEGETIEHKVGVQEGNYLIPENNSESRKNKYPDSYKDRILQFGAEAKFKAGNVGQLILAADVMMYESGKTGYQVGAYSEDYGWAKDFNLLAGFEIADSGFVVEATYHNGRFPLTNFFFNKSSYVSLGFSYSPK